MLNELKTQHREIARLSFEGFKAPDISLKTGMAISSVRTILADPLCKAYIEHLDSAADVNAIDVRKQLSQLNVKALRVLDDMLTNEVPPNVALRAAQDVLDRTGYKPIERTEHLHAHLTKTELDEIKNRVRNANNRSPLIEN